VFQTDLFQLKSSSTFEKSNF